MVVLTLGLLMPLQARAALETISSGGKSFWQWPTETTCIKDAYKNFSLWASDRTKALDWYKYPEENKVYSTK